MVRIMAFFTTFETQYFIEVATWSSTAWERPSTWTAIEISVSPISRGWWAKVSRRRG